MTRRVLASGAPKAVELHHHARDTLCAQCCALGGGPGSVFDFLPTQTVQDGVLFILKGQRTGSSG